MIFISSELAIKLHFANITYTDDYIIRSGFMLALKDARKATNRDEDTGDKIIEIGNHDSWLGAMGYLAILDQIGSCFKPKNTATIEGNPIVKALLYFGKITVSEAEALFALRCSFANNYSLFNINSKKSKLTHFFSLCDRLGGPIVRLPKSKWNGDITNVNEGNITTINLGCLGDLVEAINENLLTLADGNHLQIILKGGANELYKRYSVCTLLYS